MKRIKRLFCFALAFLLAFTTVDPSGFSVADKAKAATGKAWQDLNPVFTEAKVGYIP